MTTPEQLAAAGNSWGLFRSALAAGELRTEAEQNVPASARALEGARMVLDRTVGNPLPDAVLARIRALRIRENAFIQIVIRRRRSARASRPPTSPRSTRSA